MFFSLFALQLVSGGDRLDLQRSVTSPPVDDDHSFALFYPNKENVVRKQKATNHFGHNTRNQLIHRPSAISTPLDSLETNGIIGNDDTKLPCSCVRVSECKFHRIVLAIVCVFISSCVPPFLIFGQERQLFGCCNFHWVSFQREACIFLSLISFQQTRSHTFSLRAKPKYFSFLHFVPPADE